MPFLLQTPQLDTSDLMLPDSVQKAQMAEVYNRIVSADYNEVLNALVRDCVWIVIKIVLAMFIYIVGRQIIRWIVRILDRAFVHHEVELSLRTFLRSAVKAVMMIVLLLIIVQTLGVNTSSVLALFASAGLAIGMALSGTLQNFAGGVMILFLKPYRVGDYIDAQGEEGTVSKIGLFSTEIRTVDNRVIYIPNSTISTSVIDNYSMGEMRRVDWTVSAEYGTDATKLREVLMTLLRADSRIVEEPAPVVYVTELTEGSVKFSARGWVRNADYWDVKFDMNERIYNELGKQGIKFANPQLDVTIKNN